MEELKNKKIPFDRLEKSDLYVDAVYEGGSASNIRAEVLSHLLPKCGNSGGFRKVKRKTTVNLPMLFYILRWKSWNGRIFRYRNGHLPLLWR